MHDYAQTGPNSPSPLFKTPHGRTGIRAVWVDEPHGSRSRPSPDAFGREVEPCGRASRTVADYVRRNHTARHLVRSPVAFGREVEPCGLAGRTAADSDRVLAFSDVKPRDADWRAARQPIPSNQTARRGFSSKSDGLLPHRGRFRPSETDSHLMCTA